MDVGYPFTGAYPAQPAYLLPPSLPQVVFLPERLPNSNPPVSSKVTERRREQNRAAQRTYQKKKSEKHQGLQKEIVQADAQYQHAMPLITT